MHTKVKEKWNVFSKQHPSTAQFLVFFLLSNGITVLQLVLMPLVKALFGMTELVNMDFQIGRIGMNVDNSPYYIFDYAAGALPEGGGDLRIFLRYSSHLRLRR